MKFIEIASVSNTNAYERFMDLFEEWDFIVEFELKRHWSICLDFEENRAME